MPLITPAPAGASQARKPNRFAKLATPAERRLIGKVPLASIGDQVVTGISVATRVRGPEVVAILKLHKFRRGEWNRPREIVIPADRLLSLATALHEAAEVLGLLAEEEGE